MEIKPASGASSANSEAQVKLIKREGDNQAKVSEEIVKSATETAQEDVKKTLAVA